MSLYNAGLTKEPFSQVLLYSNSKFHGCLEPVLKRALQMWGSCIATAKCFLSSQDTKEFWESGKIGKSGNTGFLHPFLREKEAFWPLSWSSWVLCNCAVLYFLPKCDIICENGKKLSFKTVKFFSNQGIFWDPKGMF